MTFFGKSENSKKSPFFRPPVRLPIPDKHRESPKIAENRGTTIFIIKKPTGKFSGLEMKKTYTRTPQDGQTENSDLVLLDELTFIKVFRNSDSSLNF